MPVSSAWAAARDGLSARDPVMADLIRRFPFDGLVSRGAPFETLLRAIVGQQISVRAADAIWARLSAIAQTGSPASLLALDEAALRTAGLSGRKVAYVQDLARHFADGRIDPACFDALADDEIIRLLSAVHGIGRWTAEMFLIFNLVRHDVWPVDDIGLQKAVQQAYGLPDRPVGKVLMAHGERFRPWRTVACWYLWRSLDPVEVMY